jgi:Predicted outer membrane lipoprotein
MLLDCNRERDITMRRISTKLAFAPALIAALGLSTIDASPAFARHHYRSHAHYRWCRHSSGTTGLVAGGAGGALLGHALIGGPVGIVAGAVGGALGGRAIDRTLTAKKRCR